MSYDLSLDKERITEIVKRVPPICVPHPWSLDFPAADRVDLWLRADLSERNGKVRPLVHDAAARARAREEAGRRDRATSSRTHETLARARARNYVISCGAALFNLRLAIRVLGHNTAVELLPDWAYADPMRPPARLASVEIETGRIKGPSIAEQELYEAIARVHTSRQPYRILRVPPPIIAEMEVAAVGEGAYLRLLTSHEARIWEHLTAGTDGGSASPAPEQGVRSSGKPRWMALSTDDDQPLDWLRAGQALQRAILTGTRYSVLPRYGTSCYSPQLQDDAAARSHWHWPGMPVHDRVSALFLAEPSPWNDGMGESPSWPWHWLYKERLQMVVRVGYAALEGGELPAVARWNDERQNDERPRPSQQPPREALSATGTDTGRDPRW